MNQRRWGFGGWIMACAAVIGMSAFIGACRNFGDYCQEATDCADGNELDQDACEIGLEFDADRADDEGCGEYFDAFFACVEENSSCDNDNYAPDADDCENESEDYNNCRGDDDL